MRKLLFVLLVSSFAHAQTALYNNGSIRIHEGGELGFHTNLINEMPFDENLGRAGFYGNRNINISGFMAPTFYDVDILANGGVTLDVGINSTNNTT
ncbi:MAG: gliding motility-associated C-terminal domain-containing protein, partial [Flavobacteriaceae bacterium]